MSDEAPQQPTPDPAPENAAAAPENVPENVAATPYRTQPLVLSPPRVPWRVTVWGPSVTVASVSVWGFVVLGELVTSYAPGGQRLLLGEATAVFLLLSLVVAIGIGALVQSLRAAPAPVGDAVVRGLSIGGLAFLLCCATMIFAVIFGRVIRADALITLVLLAGAVTAFVHGRRASGEPRVFPRALSLGAALVTAVALLAHAAS